MDTITIQISQAGKEQTVTFPATGVDCTVERKAVADAVRTSDGEIRITPVKVVREAMVEEIARVEGTLMRACERADESARVAARHSETSVSAADAALKAAGLAQTSEASAKRDADRAVAAKAPPAARKAPPRNRRAR